MNNTTLILNDKDEFELFLLKIGSTWIIDGINIFISFPVGMIGFVLNIYSFSLFLKISIKSTRLYKYLRIYCLNSALLCLISGFAFLAYSPRFFPYYTMTAIKYYRCHVFNFVGTTFYFFGNLLDIFINWDRITIFNQRAKFINQIPFLKLCLSAFLFCFVVNFPAGLLYYARTDAEFEQEAKLNLNNFSYCGQTSFLNSTVGSIITVLVIFIRDFMTLVIEIMAGCTSLYYYRKNYQNSSLTSTISIDLEQGKIQKKSKKRDQNGKRLFLMTISMSAISVISHFIIIIAYICAIVPALKNNIFYFYSICFSGLSINFKHSSNYLIFYLFNRNFRKLSLR